jgi:thymidylate synthase
VKQYLDLVRRTLREGFWIPNDRTGIDCLTIIGASMEYDVGAGELPMVTTRKCFVRQAISELLGYLRGYDSAAQFRALGCKTWDANANENESWLANKFRKGEDDMGRVYGVQGRQWTNSRGETLDQLQKIYDHLKAGIDDRGEILTFWNPGEFDQGCLRPCMHTHTFSLVDGTLYLDSMQRSSDLLLGTVFNMVQCYVLLALMAQITGHKPGKVHHRNINCHIYRNQYDVLLAEGQLKREPFPSPTMKINPEIKTLEDVLTWVTADDFEVIGYQSHPSIVYPFAV